MDTRGDVENPSMTDNTSRDETLAEESPVTPDAADVIDTTPEVTPEDFDFEAFLEGARPNRRSVKLYMRADLIGRMEELAEELAEVDDLSEDDPRLAQFEQARRDFHASGRWFTVEARSGEWVEKIRRDIAGREFGLRINDDGTLSKGPRRDEALQAITCEVVAQQLVTPTGATRAGVARLAETSPTEFRKLLVAQQFANNSLAEKAKVLDVDFSHAPSTDTPRS